MYNSDIIGYVGTGVLTVTLMPQVYKTFESKRASDLSWIYLFLQITANVLFIFYGLSIGSLPVTISNCVVSVMSITLIYAKCKFGSNPEQSPLIHFAEV
jgi:MtN3 and saliva related transmembrane protein